MKLREEEFYNQYHQHGGTTIIPTEIFNELYDDATEKIERLNNIILKLKKVLWQRCEEARGKLYDLNYKIKEIYNVPFDITEIFEIIDLLDRVKNK